MKMRIRYKVVTKSRKSSIIPKTSIFSLRYLKGHIVEALPGSLGVMVFANRDCAISFKFMVGHGKIIKVRPIGRKIIPEKVCVTFYNARSTTTVLTRFNKLFAQHAAPADYHMNILPPPDGTECYKSVEVLE